MEQLFLEGCRRNLTLVGGAAVVCPVVLRAQQPDRMRRIGVLTPFASDELPALYLDRVRLLPTAA